MRHRAVSASPRRPLNLAAAFALGAAALLGTGCRTESRGTSLLEAEGGAVEPLMVVDMGGFNSCTSQNGKLTPANTDLDKHRDGIYGMFPWQGRRPTWVRSCYDKSGTIYYQWAHMVDDISTFTPQTTNFQTLQPIVDTVAREAQRYPKRPLYLVGHSHGGWLALKVALALPESIKLAGLVTIDPISRVNCGVTSIVWQNHSGCQEAPADISDEDRGRILGRIVSGGEWRHYYQRNFVPLRSNVYGGTNVPHIQRDLSPFMNYTAGGSNAAINAHTMIDNLDTPWLGIRGHMQKLATSAGGAGLGLAEGDETGDAAPHVSRDVAVQYLEGLGFTCSDGAAPAEGYTTACQGDVEVPPFEKGTWKVSLKLDAQDMLERYLVEPIH